MSLPKLRTIPLEKGNAYAGRCAGGSGEGFGGQYLIIAADQDVLAKVWEAIEGIPLNPLLVYDAAAIGTPRLEKMLEPDPLHAGRDG